MTTRVLSGITVVVLGVLLLCSGLAGILLFGGAGATAGCVTVVASEPAFVAAPPEARSGGMGPVGQWNAEQVANAATIIAVGQGREVPPRGWVIAVATAMQESRLINVPGGADDSVGLFQQRPSQGWGTLAELHDPQYAAAHFYQKLLTIDGWQTMPLTEAAQKVQISAYPDAYAKWEPDATQLVAAALSGVTAGAGTCGTTISAQGWTRPVHGEVGSGFRTAGRPGHDGVDLIVAKGTPIHAAAAGIVSRVRCNATDVRTGTDWGCDRDGDPNRTAGCGWYVDIDHDGGIVTRYCHQLARPYVQVGQHVDAGEVIGICGSSGHSSGPHLHFEVHLGDHSAQTAVDPVAFMASVAAPLDPPAGAVSRSSSNRRGISVPGTRTDIRPRPAAVTDHQHVTAAQGRTLTRSTAPASPPAPALSQLPRKAAMSTAVERFRDADRRYETLCARWNALPTPQARRVCGLQQPLSAARIERQATAANVLRDAAGRHTIEQKPGVYLLLAADGRWEIDPLTFDGAPLSGYDDGALNEACEHDGDGLDSECDVLAQAAGDVPLPTAGELTALLLGHLCRHDEPGLSSLNLDGFSDDALNRLTARIDAHRRRQAG